MLSWCAWRAATAVYHRTPSETRGARGEHTHGCVDPPLWWGGGWAYRRAV